MEDVQEKVDEIIMFHKHSESFLKVILHCIKSENFDEEITIEELSSVMVLFKEHYFSAGFGLQTLKANIEFLLLDEDERSKQIQKVLPT